MDGQTLKIDTMLYEGAPEDCSKRAEREQRTYRLLDGLCIPFVRVDHAPANTISDCENIDLLLGTHMCKNLFLCNRQKTDFYLLLMPGEKPFRTKDLSKQLGVARLSFAEDGPMLDYLDILPGSVSVLGLMNDLENHVRLLVDADVFAEPYIGCHPCVNTSSLKIAHDDIFLKFLPAVHHDWTVVTL